MERRRGDRRRRQSCRKGVTRTKIQIQYMRGALPGTAEEQVFVAAGVQYRISIIVVILIL